MHTNQVGPGEKLGMSLDTSDTLVALVSIEQEYDLDMDITSLILPWILHEYYPPINALIAFVFKPGSEASSIRLPGHLCLLCKHCL